jgi:hypothetical protein
MYLRVFSRHSRFLFGFAILLSVSYNDAQSRKSFEVLLDVLD